VVKRSRVKESSAAGDGIIRFVVHELGITMSSVNSIGNNLPVQQIASTAASKPPAASTNAAGTAASRGADRVELSGISHLLSSLKTSDIRVDKVSSIKSQIEAGTYDIDGKLDITADRLLDDLQ
jgi:flagellar biosynthesis anti-sigma factor FlgM